MEAAPASGTSSGTAPGTDTPSEAAPTAVDEYGWSEAADSAVLAALDGLDNTGQEDAAATKNSAIASEAFLVGPRSQDAEHEYGEPLILPAAEETALASMEVATAKHWERADTIEDEIAERLAILKQLTGIGTRGRPK